MSSIPYLFNPPSRTSPEEERRRRSAMSSVGAISDWTAYEKAKASLERLESGWVPDNIQSQVFDALEQQYGGPEQLEQLSPMAFDQVYKDAHSKLSSDYMARVDGLKKGIADYERVAGTQPPATPLVKRDDVPPQPGKHPGLEPEPRKREGPIDWGMWALGAPSRTVSGLAGGAIEELQRGTADVPIDPTKVKEQYPARGRMSPYSPTLQKEKVSDQFRAGGVPVGVALQRLLTGEISLKKVAGSALEHAKETGSTAELITPEDLSSVLARAKDMYEEQAITKAGELEEAGEIKTMEEFEAAVQKFTQDLVEADPLANNPQTAQLLHEIVMDPLNVMGPVKLVKLLKKVPGAKQALTGAKKVALKATPAFRHLPEYDAMRLLDSPESVEMLDAAVQAEARSELVGRMGQKMSALVGVIGEVKDPKMKSFLYDWATTPAAQRPPISSLPKSLRPAAEAAVKLETQHKVLGRITGVHRRWGKGGVLKESRELEGYVPRRVRETEALGDVKVAQGRTMLEPGSAKARYGTGEEFVKDVHTQWNKEVKEFTKQAKAAYETKLIQRGAKETGYFLELDNPMAKVRSTLKVEGLGEAAQALGRAKGKVSILEKAGVTGPKLEKAQALTKFTEETIQEAKLAEDAIRGQLDTLKKDTGVEWGMLEGDEAMHKIWGRITGTPLVTELGEKVHLLPKPIIERLSKLTPIIAETPGKFDETLKALNKVTTSTIAPLNSIFRTSVTLPFPAYHVRNAVGALGLATVAHGFKMFNPRLQVNTTRLVMAAAGLGSKKALKFKSKLPSGEIATGEELLNMARQDGVINQFDELLQAHKVREGWGPAKLAIGAAQKAAGPGRTMGNAIENYQKLIGYLGFLEGKSRGARAKATRLTDDFMLNYRRMGEADKQVFSEIMPFWAWTRNISAWQVRRMVDSPERLALWEKAYRWNEAEWEKKFPRVRTADPHNLKGMAWTANRRLQPKPIRDYIDKGIIPEPGSEQYVKVMMENPITMGMSAWRDLESLFGKRGTRQARERLVMHLGPVAKTFLDGIVGHDIVSGRPITEVMGTGPQSHMGQLGRTYLKRPASTWNAIANLYVESKQPAALIDLQAKLAARNAWQGLDKLFMTMAGESDAALPMTMPGASLRYIDPRRQQARAVKEGNRLLQGAVHSEVRDEFLRLTMPHLTGDE